jgi:ribonuclease BN (tRNA processing enzyme)
VIRVLGSGTAFNTDGRGSACLWMESPEVAPFLIDVGPTAMSAMQRAGLDCRRIDRVFLTHLHGDHTAGWPFLLLHLAVLARRKRPLQVVGPPGTRRVLEGLAELCYGEILAEHGFEVRYDEIAVEPAREIEAGDGLLLDTFPMEHHATSIGLLFRFGGARIGVSGDTAWCEALERLGRESDILFVECTSTTRQAPGHLFLDELRRRRDRLGSGLCVLVHLTDAVAEELARDPLPGVIAAHDGMTYSP